MDTIYQSDENRYTEDASVMHYAEVSQEKFYLDDDSHKNLNQKKYFDIFRENVSNANVTFNGHNNRANLCKNEICKVKTSCRKSNSCGRRSCSFKDANNFLIK